MGLEFIDGWRILYDSDGGGKGAQAGRSGCKMHWCWVCILVNAMDACGETAFGWGGVWIDDIVCI
jgi:hypothetical protein